jgi:major type 1 subunit fimbrin (pilin)
MNLCMNGRTAMKSLGRSGARRGLGVPGLLVGLGLFGLASGAQATTTCTGTAQTVTVPLPASVAVPRDAAVGTLLSAWVATVAANNWWTCSSNVQESIGAAFRTLLTGASGVSIVDNGVTYPVYDTNLPGVGIAMGAKVYANGCGWQANWVPVTGSRQTGLLCNSVELRPNGGQLRAVLVKTGPIVSGVVSPGPVAQAQSYANAAYDTSMIVTLSTTATQVTALSCQTPDVLVTMPPSKTADFGGPGSTTPSKTFAIGLKNCPAGLGMIKYQVDAVTAIVNSANGVVALDGTSSATGVGLQLLDGAGNVFPLGTPRTLSGYNAATGGDYSIPLRARYYQTGPQVGAGSANTGMTFTMSYL